MKSKIYWSVAVTVISVLIVSCSKSSTTSPSAAETNATLLAGTKGGSKTWALSSITDASSAGSQSVTAASGIPACESDNVFKFSYDAAQSYAQTEGATMCNIGQTDPSTVETGNWAFSDDGKSLLIESSYFPSSTQIQNEDGSGYFLAYMILSEGIPLNVLQITSTSLTVTYTYTDSSSLVHTVTLVFTKMP